jgi:hypothetical protein
LKIMKYAYRGLNVGSSCPSDKKTFDGVEEWREFGYFNYFQNADHMAARSVAWVLTARTLGSCVRISLEVWICICLWCAVLSLRPADHPSKKSYEMSKRIHNFRTIS